MTIWENIYRNFNNGGEAWATLSEGIHPLFRQFLDHSEFALKYALDIGCGTGIYLQLLQAGGFRTDGIDSSQTAVEMTKKELGSGSQILCVNMFGYEIPKDRYDLVISASTIHHGTKEQVRGLVNNIYEAIAQNGKIFITVPDLESSKKWNTFKQHREIAAGTYAPSSGPERGLPHSFYAEEEVQNIFSMFNDLRLDLDDRGRWIVQAVK